MLRLLIRRYPRTNENIVAKPMPTVKKELSPLLHQRLIMMTALLSNLQMVFGSMWLSICLRYSCCFLSFNISMFNIDQ